MIDLEKTVEIYNQTEGQMHLKDGFNCDACKNKGLIFHLKGEEIVSKMCDCIKSRKSIFLLRESGIGDFAEGKTFDSFKISSPWQEAIIQRAKQYVSGETDKWFYIGGQSGCGKTHVCTSICMELIKQGNSLVYMKWADATRQLRDAMNRSYNEEIEQYKSADVLYIDDFFKVQAGCEPSSSDVKIAFEILNTRLLKNKKTVISSEFMLSKLLSFDEATISRIVEKSAPYILSINKDSGKNYRLNSLSTH